MMKYTFILTFCSLSLMACSNNTINENTSDTSVTAQKQASVQQLAQKDLDTILQQDSVILIDVRTPGEVNQGYIPGADSFMDYNSGEFSAKVDGLDKNYTYVMYCRSGGRSGKASSEMIKKGFTRVYNLQGGVMNYKGTLTQP